MATIRVDTEIQAPAERVWRILMDFAAYPEWNPFVVGLEGEPREGATLRARMRLGAEEIPVEVEAVRVVPSREFAWAGGFRLRWLLNAVHEFRIEPSAGGGVRFVHEENIRGLLAPLMVWRMGEALPDQFRALNEALKRRAESALATVK